MSSPPQRPSEISQAKMRRATIACVKCRHRKVKCERVDNDPYSRAPCKRCSRRNFDCQYVSVQEQEYQQDGSEISSILQITPTESVPSPASDVILSGYGSPSYGSFGFRANSSTSPVSMSQPPFLPSTTEAFASTMVNDINTMSRSSEYSFPMNGFTDPQAMYPPHQQPVYPPQQVIAYPTDSNSQAVAYSYCACKDYGPMHCPIHQCASISV